MRSARTLWTRALLTAAAAVGAGTGAFERQVLAATPALVAREPAQADELEKREKAARSPDDLFEVAQWADGKGLKPQAKRLMQRVLFLDPKHVGANEYFGKVLYKGEWISPDEREKRIVESEGPAMRAKGLVRWQGRWVTPEDQAHLEKGEVLFEGRWLPFADAQRARGLEEFEGQWLPWAEAIARRDVAASVQVTGTPVSIVVGPDAIVCGVQDEAVLTGILAGLAKGRAWFDATFQSKPGLELFGGRLAEFYLYDSNDAFALTVAHFGALTRTVSDGWVEAAQKTHGFLWWDPYPLSSARRWHRNEQDLVGHSYHHWGHLLANRLEYDGRLLPPWFDEGIASLLEFRVHGRNDVFCRGSRKDPRPAGPTTGGDKPAPKPRTKVGGANVRSVAPFDPKAMQDGSWLEALKAGLIDVPPFDDLASLQFDELETADIAASMAIVEWIETRGPGALRRFHAELRRRAPPQPQRVLETAAQRMVCYEAAFRAAAGVGLADADKAWRAWTASR